MKKLKRRLEIAAFVFVAIPANITYNLFFHPRRFWRGIKRFIKNFKEVY